MKSVQIRSFSGPNFYSVSLCIQSKYGKIRTRKSPVFGHFSRKRYSSAISAFHRHIDGKPMGQHPNIVHVWQEFTITTIYYYVGYESGFKSHKVGRICIKANWRENKELSLKQLTYRLAILLALSSASRVSSVRNLDIHYVAKTEDEYIFTLINCIKIQEKDILQNQTCIMQTSCF